MTDYFYALSRSRQIILRWGGGRLKYVESNKWLFYNIVFLTSVSYFLTTSERGILADVVNDHGMLVYALT
jgi:hypothetical protein